MFQFNAAKVAHQLSKRRLAARDLVTGDVGALRFAVTLGAVSTLVSGIGARVFLSLSGIGGLGARGRQEHCRGGGHPKIRAGQFHATKVTYHRQTNNRSPH